MPRLKFIRLTTVSICALAATAHAAPQWSKATSSGAETAVAKLSIVTDNVVASAKVDAQGLLMPTSNAGLPPLAKLSEADRNKVVQDENKIIANEKTIAEEAELSGNKDVTLKAKDIVADENKRLQLALRNGDGKKVLAVETAVIRQQVSFQSSLLQYDRRNLLERQKVDDEFAVAVLPELGAANVLPSNVDDLDFWSSASQLVKAVGFYGEDGELLALDPRSVIMTFKFISKLGSGDKAGDESLKAAFRETDPLVKEFGVAGLFGEMVHLQNFQGEPEFKKDMVGLDHDFIDEARNFTPSASAVPEAPVWGLMILGLGLLGGLLRGRRIACAAT